MIITWTEYLTVVVDQMRKRFADHLKDLRTEISISENLISEVPIIRTMLPQPCQIKVFEFASLPAVFWVVTHTKDQPDKQFTIFENIKEDFKAFSASCRDFDPNLVRFHELALKRGLETFSLTILRLSMLFTGDKIVYLFQMNPRTRFSPMEVANVLFENERPYLHPQLSRYQMGGMTREIRHQASEVKEKEVRSKLLKSVGKIDISLNKMKTLEEEVRGVRTLVGISKEFKDWKILVSDVHRLKGEHVPREVFQAKISELNTRIDSLSEIREAYDKVLSQQNEFMKQQAKVMEQQSSVIKWIKYATILLPIAVISVPIIEIISILIRHSLGIP